MMIVYKVEYNKSHTYKLSYYIINQSEIQLSIILYMQMELLNWLYVMIVRILKVRAFYNNY